ncbi:MAG: hypothetical protein LBG44_07075 [Gemmatimonadota bacterium]|jgi:hypothetical protein|nr:hypothetical protein [Gemmatimonadota bacterium]
MLHPSLKRLAFALLVASVLAGVARPAVAQFLPRYDFAGMEFRGVGMDAMRVWATRIEPTTGVAIRADLGFIGPRVRIMPTARFWSSSLNNAEVERLASQIVLVCERQENATCPETLDLGEVRFSDLEFSLDGHFLLFGNRAIAPYLGAGLSLHLLNGSGESINGTFVEDLLDSVAPGIGGLVGSSVHLASSLALLVEGRFMLGSDVRYAGATVGGYWTLPRPSSGFAGLAH